MKGHNNIAKAAEQQEQLAHNKNKVCISFQLKWKLIAWEGKLQILNITQEHIRASYIPKTITITYHFISYYKSCEKKWESEKKPPIYIFYAYYIIDNSPSSSYIKV